MALLFQPGQQGKGVLAEEIHVVETVAFGVALCHGNGFGADVGSSHPGCPALGRVQGKAAGMGKTVQHGMPGGKACYRPTIIFLVKEKAGLLPVFKVHMVVDAVFADLGLGGFRVALAGQGEPALVLFQPLLGAQGFVVALIDAVNGLSVRPQHLSQKREEHRLQPFHAYAQGLGDQNIVEPVHRQAGELVCFAKDEAAGREVGRLQHRFAVRPCVLHPAAPEGGVKGVVGVAGNKAYPDLALQREKTGAEIGALGADHIHQRAVFRRGAGGFQNVVLVHPGVPAHQKTLGVLVDFIYRISAFAFHKMLLQLRMRKMMLVLLFIIT